MTAVAWNLEPGDRELATTALRLEAERWRKAAERLADELAQAKRADPSLDVRTQSVHVAEALGKAGALERMTTALEHAPMAAGIVTEAPKRRGRRRSSGSATTDDAQETGNGAGQPADPGVPTIPPEAAAAHDDPDVAAAREVLAG